MKLRDAHRRAVRAAAANRQGGDAPRAIDIMGEVLSAAPNHAAANVEMARALRVIGDPAEAEGFYRTALSAVLDYVVVCELAAVVGEQGRTAEAEELIDAALTMADGHPRLDPGEALLVRAALALGEGRTDDARAALDKIVRKRATPATKRYEERLRARLEPSDLDRP